MKANLDQIREALEESWDEKTAYQMIFKKDNPAFGQCYPTSRVIQLFFPEAEIIEGVVWTGKSIEKHFWNFLTIDGEGCHIDLTWEQFPKDSIVKSWKVRGRNSLGDSQETLNRVNLLFERVRNCIPHRLHKLSNKLSPNNRVDTNQILVC